MLCANYILSYICLMLCMSISSIHENLFSFEYGNAHIYVSKRTPLYLLVMVCPPNRRLPQVSYLPAYGNQHDQSQYETVNLKSVLG